MIVKDSISFVVSDVDDHFTDALTENASEYEDIDLTGTAGLGGEARCYITSIRLISAQNLAWMVGFHLRDNTAPGTDSVIGHLYDQNTMIDFWVWAASEARGVGTAYIYAVSGLKVPYRDDERRGELHVSLHNRSTTAKIAATGYVQMRFGIAAAA